MEDPQPREAQSGERSARGEHAHQDLDAMLRERLVGCISHANHFSVSTRPFTNHLCISSTTRAGGSMASIAVAITSCHSTAASPPSIIRLMPITVVYISSWVVTSSGQRYWFHP